MKSQKIFKITPDILGLIISDFKRLGNYADAVRLHLDLPSFDYEHLRDWAGTHYRNGTINDDYVIAKCWIKAYESLMIQSGLTVEFSFVAKKSS